VPHVVSVHARPCQELGMPSFTTEGGEVIAERECGLRGSWAGSGSREIHPGVLITCSAPFPNHWTRNDRVHPHLHSSSKHLRIPRRRSLLQIRRLGIYCILHINSISLAFSSPGSHATPSAQNHELIREFNPDQKRELPDKMGHVPLPMISTASSSSGQT